MRRGIASLIVLFLLSTPAFAHHYRHHHYHHRHHARHRVIHVRSMVGGLGHGMIHMLESMQPHPEGCPHTAFCGCGSSVYVFGHPVRDLYLAANWFRFPRAPVAVGNAIVRQHHVKIISGIEPDGSLICYDPNSGGHATRIHACRVDGAVVNPRG